ncbi:MAG TPA: carboxypeptidase-like regulatory domain-containing protein [Candidatus Tumulicola sp.]|jgi:hypothetical protein
MYFIAYVLAAVSALSTAPQITGSLVDYNGKPASKVAVSVVELPTDRVVGKTISGTDGSFSFRGIASGTYGVEARTSSACAMSDAVTVNDGFTKIVGLRLIQHLCTDAISL